MSMEGRTLGDSGGIRTFVAVLLDEAVRRPLASLLVKAAGLPSDVKWVEAANLHITVKFLGNVPAPALPAIGQALAGVAQGFWPFDVRVTGLGTFPSHGTPRVVWVGLEGEAAQGRGAAPAAAVAAPEASAGGRARPAALVTLAGAVEVGLGALGYPREDRPFAAHITLGRVRGQRGQAELKAFIEKESAFRAGAQAVSEIALMRSDLRPEGPVYTKLAGFPLGRGSTATASDR